MASYSNMKHLLSLISLLCALSCAAYGQGAPPLTVQEADGSPRKNGITKIVVSNGTLTISGTTATITTGGGGSSGITTNAQTGTTYTFLAGDSGKLVTFSNASSVAVTLPQATGSFTTGWNVQVTNLGAGTVTITPTTSTIDGAATLTLARYQGATIVSDGTNYSTQRGGAGTQLINDMTDTWTNSGITYTAMKMNVTNTASASASRLLDLQIGGSTIFAVSRAGALQMTAPLSVQIPDSTTAGGNTRGANAVDMQFSRNSAAQVASGSNSFAAGYRNTASADGTVAIGYSNTASAAYAVALGNGATASGASSLAAQRGAASGTDAVAIGADAIASGTGSVAISTSFATANGTRSIALGNLSSARSIGDVMVYSSGKFVTNYDQQIGWYNMKRVTTDATAAVVLTTDAGAPSASNTPVLPNNSAYAFFCTCIARRTDSNDYGAWTITGAIRRDANAAATAIIGTPTVTTLATPAGAWTAPAATANTSRGSLEITVAGAAAQTVRWAANCQTIEVTN